MFGLFGKKDTCPDSGLGWLSTQENRFRKPAPEDRAVAERLVAANGRLALTREGNIRTVKPTPEGKARAYFMKLYAEVIGPLTSRWEKGCLTRSYLLTLKKTKWMAE